MPIKKRNIQNLSSKGLRNTMPRKLILEVLKNAAQRHLSAQDVRERLQLKGFDLGYATVYRVLTEFEKRKMVLKHSFDNDKAYFELNNQSHHDHMICIHCGRVFEFTEERIEQLQEEVAQSHGLRLKKHALNLYVLCEGYIERGECSK